jgi:transcriptional regulator GlxA family with amidase domain
MRPQIHASPFSIAPVASYSPFPVGYESPSQFGREYKRLFGAPPIQDLERKRLLMEQA